MTRPTFVRVFYADDSEEDAAFARELVNRISKFAGAEAMELSLLETGKIHAEWRLAFALGVPVFVLSSSDAKGAWEANPVLGNPHLRSYYVCRGFDPREVNSEAFAPLMDQAMLVPESEVDAVIADLREYHAYWKSQRLSFGPAVKALRAMAITVGSRLIDGVELILRIAQFLSIFAALLLFVSLGWSRLEPWRPALAVICGYAWGRRITWLPPLDFWPWLGRHRRSNNHGMLDKYRWFRRIALLAQFVFVLVYALPAFLTGGSRWLVVGIAAAFTMEGLLRWSAAQWLPLMAQEFGLTPERIAEEERGAAALPSAPLPPGYDGLTDSERQSFTAAQLAQIARWVSLSIGGIKTGRPFFMRPDYVFISYVWADEGSVATAAALAKTLEALQIDHFLDRRHVENSFVGWRANVARELARTTHVVVIASPGFAKGRIAQREIRAAVQRQHVELLPSILCVADDDVAAQMLCDKTAPLELRFILGCCTRLTRADAVNLEIVSHAISSRRRQGRVRDWLTLLRPGTRERAMRKEVGL